DEFAAHKYDMGYLLRELALSQTYQRSSEPPAGAGEVPPATFAVAQLKPLSPEQLAWSLMQATGLRDAERQALAKIPDAWLRQRLGLTEVERQDLVDRLTAEGAYAKLSGNVAP